jgi:Tfp pilus assembly protein PilF
MRLVSIALVSLLLQACASTGPAPVDPASLFLDGVFQARPVPVKPDIFALSEPMQHFLSTDIANTLRRRGKLRGLVSALQNRGELKLEYESTLTRTAAEAFDARAGNCLSLTIMTASLARALGLGVTFRQVYTADEWTRSDSLVFRGGHVNVFLEPSAAEQRETLDRIVGIAIDFLPGELLQGQRWREISEETVLAMYMNNRAAETIVLGQLDDAYWWVRGAMLNDPRYLEAYNTLGVVYARHGELAQAERVFRHVLAREPENAASLGNLAGLMERAGRPTEARALRERLASVQPYAPFHFLDLGTAALKRRDYSAARDYFLRELDRNADYHVAHFALAMAYLGLGEQRAAQKHLEMAAQTSTSRRDRDVYSAKMAWVRAHGAR